MFEVSNLSNNPLNLSDGKPLAPGDSRKLRKVEDTEKKYESRGWLGILEEKPSTPSVKDDEKSGGKSK